MCSTVSSKPPSGKETAAKAVGVAGGRGPVSGDASKGTGAKGDRRARGEDGKEVASGSDGEQPVRDTATVAKSNMSAKVFEQPVRIAHNRMLKPDLFRFISTLSHNPVNKSSEGCPLSACFLTPNHCVSHPEGSRFHRASPC